MTGNQLHAEPSRPADRARLELARLRVDTGTSLSGVFRHAVEISAEVLEVERAGVWLFMDDGQSLRCVDLFERSTAQHSAGTTLRTEEFPEYFAALESRKTIPAEVALNDARTSGLAEAYLAPLGITSMLDASIFVGGEVVGVLCHEHVGPPREWTTEQRDFAGSMADLLALKLKAAEVDEMRAALQVQEAHLAEARRAAEIAETAAGVAHDFNNLLQVMIGAAELITMEESSPPAVLELARSISEAGRTGVALARSLMDFSRPRPHSPRVVRPAEVLARQLTLLQSSAGGLHPVSLEIRSGTARILLDPAELERVVLNLVVNAADAMPSGGPIEVVVDAVAEPMEGGAVDDFVLVVVRDNGTGIRQELMSRIFDPFFTTKPRGKGTGVGLAVVRQIVRNAGGFIRVESEVGKGSTFRIYIPLISHV